MLQEEAGVQGPNCWRPSGRFRLFCKLSLQHLTAPNYLYLLEYSGPVSGLQETFGLATHGIKFTFNQSNIKGSDYLPCPFERTILNGN